MRASSRVSTTEMLTGNYRGRTHCMTVRAPLTLELTCYACLHAIRKAPEPDEMEQKWTKQLF